MSEVAIVQVTCPDRTNAETIARSLLSERLIACANIFDRGLSIYRWEGTIMLGEEVVTQFKTMPSSVPAVRMRIAALHPYDLPAVEHWLASVTEELRTWVIEAIKA